MSAFLPITFEEPKPIALFPCDGLPVRIDVVPTSTIKIMGVPGIPGARGRDGLAGDTFEYRQINASTLWTIPHNIGKRPSVTAISVGGRVMVGQVDHLSVNTLTITFTTPVAGLAHLV